jgi:hypothetical protein
MRPMPARSPLLIGLAALTAAAAIAAGCGGSVDDPSAGATTAASASAPTLTAPATAAPTASDTIPTPTTPPPTAPGPSAPADAVTFKDPGGVYELDVSPKWTARTVQPKAWTVGTGGPGFADNVNVFVEPLSGSIGLEDYLDASVANAPALIPNVDFTERETITLPSGEPAGRLEYRGTIDGRDLSFLAIVGVSPENAVVVTLTSEPDRIDEVTKDNEPYMRTLRLS